MSFADASKEAADENYRPRKAHRHNGRVWCENSQHPNEIEEVGTLVRELSLVAQQRRVNFTISSFET